MAGLQGFEPQPLRAAQPVDTPVAATQVAGQQLNTLSNRLQGFSDAMMQRQAEVVADKATDKALADYEKTGEFNKEDVYTIYGKAYNTAGKAAYGANAELIITEKAQALAID